MRHENNLIAEGYINSLLEAVNKSIVRKGSKVIVDGQEKDITDWMYEISEGGNALMTITTKRRRDKIDKVTKQIIAKAGDVLKLNCKLGPCSKEVKGVGSPLGTPKERYSTYDLITVCAKREDEWHTRHISVTDITEINCSGMNYVLSS